MARFRAVIKGQNGGMASRLGTAKSGIEARASSYGLEVAVWGHPDRENADADVFGIFAKAPGRREVEIGEVRLVDGVPTFIPREVTL